MITNNYFEKKLVFNFSLDFKKMLKKNLRIFCSVCKKSWNNFNHFDQKKKLTIFEFDNFKIEKKILQSSEMYANKN